jgi:hypothetical protein
MSEQPAHGPAASGALAAMKAVAPRWEPLGTVAPTALVDARLQLHQALQVAGAASLSLLRPEPDDSHSNFEWLGDMRLLATRVVPAPRPFRAAVRPVDLTLLVVDGTGHGSNGIALHGRRVDDAFAWLVAQVRAAGAGASRLTLAKHYRIPEHPVAAGLAFDASDREAFHELARWWGDFDLLLRALASRTAGASEVRCWPHHFDLATILALAPADARSVGVGLSPGDEWYAEPYVYVSPHPTPADPSALPSLVAGGHWHADGWVGAVLRGTELTARDPGAQAAHAAAFIDAAVTACRTVLQRS